MSHEDVDRVISDVVFRMYKKYEEKVNQDIDRYSKLWNKYNDKYFEMLFKFFGCSFVNDVEVSVGLIPVFPINLDSFSFSISILLDNDVVVETAAHETLHFIWFEKWKSMYPCVPRENYDSPFLE